MKKPDDLTPQPGWKQRRDRLAAWWNRSRDSRARKRDSLKKAGRKGLTLAISMVGAILVSYGAWTIYAPAGYIVGGLLTWAVQWNYGEGDG